MPPSHTTSRRSFLRASVLTSAVFGSERALTAAETRQSSLHQGSAKNVIFMVSDGMNHGALSLAKQFRTLTAQKETNWMRLYRERPVVRSLVETFSANSCVTDSAAAASAWGGGTRVNNGTLNMTPGAKAPVRTLQEKVHQSGRKVGLVTTATITHATPAGFAANIGDRGKEEDIARQYLDRRIDVLLGGGQKFFSPSLLRDYSAAGYQLAGSRDTLMRMAHDSMTPLLGIFTEGYLPMTIDRENVKDLQDQVPTLPEMAQAALDRLQHAPEGFFLMIEGARIDHAGHANDAAASVHEQLAFDDAIGVALAFVDKNPDTLLIITTDHGCGGIQMNGVNADPKQGFAPGIYNASIPFFDRLRGFNRSIEWMKQNGVGGLSGPKLAESLKQYTGLSLTEQQIKDAQGLKLSVSDIFQSHTGVGWTSGNHTGELVEFCAFGPGSQRFPAFQENREIHARMLQAMEISA
ncbi:MAG: alkaline phosphatase [Verrucomicrobiota bacterium]